MARVSVLGEGSKSATEGSSPKRRNLGSMSHQAIKQRIEEDSQKKQLEKYRYLCTISETRKAKEKEAMKVASETVQERLEAARKFNER
jgi:hypothetical protein